MAGDLTFGAKHVTSGLCMLSDCINRGHPCRYCFKIKGKMTNYLTEEERKKAVEDVQ